MMMVYANDSNFGYVKFYLHPEANVGDGGTPDGDTSQESEAGRTSSENELPSTVETEKQPPSNSNTH